VPAKVEQAIQADAFTVVLRLRTPEAAGWLHLSRQESACHMAVGPAPARGSAAEAFSFGEQVHQQLRGLVLLGAAFPVPWERVVRLDFSERVGALPSRQLFFEATGRHSNIVLADSSSTILAAALQVGAKMSRVRALRAGDAYAPPPAPPGIPPDAGQSAAEWAEAVRGVAAGMERGRGRAPSVAEAVFRGWQGVGPSLAKELCLRAGVAPDSAVGSLGGDEWTALAGEWAAWLRAIREERFVPSLCGETGAYSVLGTFPTAAPGGGSVHALLSSYYSSLKGRQQFEQARSSVQASLRSAAKKASARKAQLEKQMGSAGEADAVQRRADLLMANLHRCEPGMKEVMAEDWDTGEPVTIPLNPPKSAVEVAEGLYKRAGKMRRSREQVLPLLEETSEQLGYLEEIELAVQQLGEFKTEDDLYTLLEIRDELVAGGFMKAPSEASLEARGASKARRAAKKGRARTTEGSCREFTTPSGLKVLVGRNNRQNDALTRSAADHDLWLHARGVPGSHVILKVPSGTQVTDEERVYAANLASFFSKARGSNAVEVICVPCSEVKRPKGAPPGRVVVIRERVVTGYPSQSPAADCN